MSSENRYATWASAKFCLHRAPLGRELVKGECLPQLLSGPLGGRMGGLIEVNNATPVVGQ